MPPVLTPASIEDLGGGGTSGPGSITTVELADGTIQVVDLGFDPATQAELDAIVVDSIADADTTHAPSRNAVFDALALKLPASYLDTDGTLAANSDVKIATQKAVKTYVTANAGSGGGAAVSRSVTQASHGFAVGNAVYLASTTYTKAIATGAAAAEVVGVVSAVADANTFTLTTDGRVTGLSSLTAGAVYFLSPSSAGVLTATEPSTVGQISKPVLIADTTTSGYVVNMRGVTVGAARAVPFKFIRRTSGDITVNSVNNSTWTNLDTGLDLALSAVAGDVIEMGLVAKLESESPDVFIDVVTLVSGSPVNSVGNAGAVGNPPKYGIAAWQSFGGAAKNIGAPAHYTVVSGDLSSGSVTLRLRYITSTATNRTINAGTNYALEFYVKNLGPSA